MRISSLIGELAGEAANLLRERDDLQAALNAAIEKIQALEQECDKEHLANANLVSDYKWAVDNAEKYRRDAERWQRWQRLTDPVPFDGE